MIDPTLLSSARNGWMRIHRYRTALIGGSIIALAAGLRLYRLGAESLWYDEAFSVSLAQWPLDALLRIVDIGLRSTDRNLYNILLHVWIGIAGTSEVSVRFPSALAGIGCVVLILLVSWELFHREDVALLSAGLLAISPLHLWYSQEARTYILFTLGILASAYTQLVALRAESTRWWAANALVGTLSMYTHPFAALGIAAQNMFMIWWLGQHGWPRRVIRPWLWSQGAIVAAYAPALVDILRQPSEGWGSWIRERYGRPDLHDLVAMLGTFTYGTVLRGEDLLRRLAMVATGGMAVVGTLGVCRQRPSQEDGREGQVYALLMFMIPVATLFAISQSVPLFLARYLIIALPGFLLLVAYGLATLRPSVLTGTLMLVIIAVSAWGIQAIYAGNLKEDWRGAAMYVAARADPLDVIVLYDAYIDIPFNHYYRGVQRQFAVSRFNSDEDLERGIGFLSPRYGYTGKIWVVISHADGRVIRAKMEEVLHARLLSLQNLTGIQIAEYAVPQS